MGSEWEIQSFWESFGKIGEIENRMNIQKHKIQKIWFRKKIFKKPKKKSENINFEKKDEFLKTRCLKEKGIKIKNHKINPESIVIYSSTGSGVFYETRSTHFVRPTDRIAV